MKESQIQTAIENYLKLQENMGKLVYTKNNSGAFKTERGSFIRFGKAGSPDFFIFVKGGKTVHCEVKNEKGALNTNQGYYRARIDDLGHYYVVVRSVSDVMAALKTL